MQVKLWLLIQSWFDTVTFFGTDLKSSPSLSSKSSFTGSTLTCFLARTSLRLQLSSFQSFSFLPSCLSLTHTLVQTLFVWFHSFSLAKSFDTNVAVSRQIRKWTHSRTTRTPPSSSSPLTATIAFRKAKPLLSSANCGASPALPADSRRSFEAYSSRPAASIVVHRQHHHFHCHYHYPHLGLILAALATSSWRLMFHWLFFGSRNSSSQSISGDMKDLNLVFLSLIFS